jgi:hypothetical protein
MLIQFLIKSTVASDFFVLELIVAIMRKRCFIEQNNVELIDAKTE